MSLRKMNADGEWVDDDTPEPRRSNRGRHGPGGSRLNVVGWVFILIGVVGVLVGGVAALGLGLETRIEQRIFGTMLGGGMLGAVVLLAVILRVLGVPFFRDVD